MADIDIQFADQRDENEEDWGYPGVKRVVHTVGGSSYLCRAAVTPYSGISPREFSIFDIWRLERIAGRIDTSMAYRVTNGAEQNIVAVSLMSAIREQTKKDRCKDN